jgi:hypothetical protein
MTVEEWALVASVVFTGLWSGLFGMLKPGHAPMLAAMSGYDFARFPLSWPSAMIRARLRSCSHPSAYARSSSAVASRAGSGRAR